MLLLETTICWAIFYALYWLLYRQETFFQLNRLYLLVTLILGVILPWNVTKWLAERGTSPTVTQWLDPVVIGSNRLETGVSHWVISYQEGLLYAYGFGCLVVAFRFLIGLKKLYFLYQKSKKHYEKGYVIAKTEKEELPFSFLNIVFWSNSNDQKEAATKALILRHELAHIQQRHSYDVLLLELLSIFFWCSPLIYCYKKSLRTVHEYLADEAATQQQSKHEYGRVLLRQLQSGLQPTLTNSFVHAQLKQRFAMLIKPSSPRMAYMKYAFCAPMLFILSFVLHQQSLMAQEVTYSNGFKVTQYKDYRTEESIDTIIVFDPATYKESTRIVTNLLTIPKTPDQAPEFIGGETALLQFIVEHARYPKEARTQKVNKGRVFVSFVVDENGNVSHDYIKKSCGNTLLDDAALRVVRDMLFQGHPFWKPAVKDGKKVACDMVLPVQFNVE